MTDRVCLVRFHDGTAKSNWGGRATSLALGRVVARSGRHLASVVNGSYIVNGLGLDSRAREVGEAAKRLARRAHLPVRPKRSYAPEEWASLPDLARGLVGDPPSKQAAAVVAALRGCDEVWVNGEGDLILAERPTLYRTLLIVHMAVALGRPVRMTNSILSEPAGSAASPVVQAAVGRALGECRDVTYRDPASLRLHQALFPEIEATWLPDALFAWAPEAQQLAARRDGFSPFTEGLPIAAQELLCSGKPYVAISGSSARWDRAAAKRGLIEVASGLGDRSLVPVVVATDKGDGWMLDVAAERGLVAISSTVPLAAGLAVLAGAACFVSGRYHPAIMASDGGTPCVFMGSNSHKTRSLQEVLGSTEPAELPLFGLGPAEQVLEATAAAMATDRAATSARAVELSAMLW